MRTYFELIQLQFAGIFTHTQNILQVHRRFDVLNTQLLEPGKLKTKCELVHVHD